MYKDRIRKYYLGKYLTWIAFGFSYVRVGRIFFIYLFVLCEDVNKSLRTQTFLLIWVEQQHRFFLVNLNITICPTNFANTLLTMESKDNRALYNCELLLSLLPTFLDLFWLVWRLPLLFGVLATFFSMN